MSSSIIKCEASTNENFQIKLECPSDHDHDQQINPQNLRFTSSDSKSASFPMESAREPINLRPRKKRRKLIDTNQIKTSTDEGNKSKKNLKNTENHASKAENPIQLDSSSQPHPEMQPFCSNTEFPPNANFQMNNYCPQLSGPSYQCNNYYWHPSWGNLPPLPDKATLDAHPYLREAYNPANFLPRTHHQDFIFANNNYNQGAAGGFFGGEPMEMHMVTNNRDVSKLAL